MSVKFTNTVLERTEIQTLLDLQADNMKAGLSPETAQAEGFLTFRYTQEMLLAMLADMPQPIVKTDGQLAGYALATSREVSLRNKLLAPAIHLTDSLDYGEALLKVQPYYVMGQICIRKEFRSMGVFDQLYQAHRSLFSTSYDYLVTEIAQENTRSFAAHQRVGFKLLHRYSDEHTNWNLVIWDWN